MVIDMDQFNLIKVNVNQFYGIEIDPFASYIAKVAMWIIDHQMNVEASIYIGATYARLPLKEQAEIVNKNSLLINWHNVLDIRECNFILGNPPFVGNYRMTEEQTGELKSIAKGLKKVGQMDYVAGWFIKAAEYIEDTNIRVGFVSTNSIVQGEQAINLWPYLMETKKIKIFFAHQTFKWTNEARGKAAVYCVIVGFSHKDVLQKTLFTYPNISGEPVYSIVKNISQYLFDSPTSFIKTRSKPFSDVPPMVYGTKPVDGGNYIFNEEEMIKFIKAEPLSEKYFVKYIGADELIYNKPRYILYLKDCLPQDLRKMPLVRARMLAVQEKRRDSPKVATRKWGDTPALLTEDRYEKTDVLIIPIHTSENREYIPIAYYSKDTMGSNAVFQISNANSYLFGVLTSRMHMDWMRLVAGRLESRYRYANTIVYNNFVFPETNEKEKRKISQLADQILSIRNMYYQTGSTLADLYDSINMPVELRKAHSELDIAVEKAYRGKRFNNNSDRLTHLLTLYAEKTNKK